MTIIMKDSLSVREIRLLRYHTINKSKVLSERKHAIMWDLKKALDKVSKRKGDKISKKL